MLVATVGLCSFLAWAQPPPAGVEGEWRTNLGALTIAREGETLKASFARPMFPTLTGPAGAMPLLLRSADGALPPRSLQFDLNPPGRELAGTLTVGQARQAFSGWQADPDAPRAERVNVSGLWLTSLGLMELEQTNDQFTGRYALRGTSSLEGTVAGRQLTHTYRWLRPGAGWFDLDADGKTLRGAAHGDGSDVWYAWKGRRAPEFARHVAPKPGAIVDGSTKGLLTYCLRTPGDHLADPARKRTAVVLLHGSNMNSKAYVATFAAAWPELAERFLLLGINGELPADFAAAEPTFNYTYINYVGRSTFGGFPGTDRESPALVREALEELKSVYSIESYLVGGHSQGGYLAYSLLMNSPELFAGAFPISGGLIVQCEPSAYADERLRAAQRRVPLAIVHGTGDPVVSFDQARYASDLFGEANWPALRLFADEQGGHMFARLPVGEAVGWLAAQSAKDVPTLLDAAESALDADRPRDAIAALDRARRLTPDADQQARLARIDARIDAQAGRDAARLAAGDFKAIDDFLAWRDKYEFARAARPAMKAFAKLRDRHEPEAKRIYGEASQLFSRGEATGGYAKYKELIDKTYASSYYRRVKRAYDSAP